MIICTYICVTLRRLWSIFTNIVAALIVSGWEEVAGEEEVGMALKVLSGTRAPGAVAGLELLTPLTHPARKWQSGTRTRTLI